MKVIRAIDKVLSYFCNAMMVLLCTVMITSAFLQVVTRMLFNDPLSWTDELCRFSMVWLAIFAGAIAVKEHAHIGVNMLRDSLPPKARWILERFIACIVTAFSSALMVYGFQLSAKNFNQLTTGLQIPMGAAYLCLPIGGAIMVFYGVLEIFCIRQKLREDT